jgi:hypothetical protein
MQPSYFSATSLTSFMLERQASAKSFLLGARAPAFCFNAMPGPFLFIALEYDATLCCLMAYAASWPMLPHGLY